jgi:hypothetical protein
LGGNVLGAAGRALSRLLAPPVPQDTTVNSGPIPENWADRDPNNYAMSMKLSPEQTARLRQIDPAIADPNLSVYGTYGAADRARFAEEAAREVKAKNLADLQMPEPSPKDFQDRTLTAMPWRISIGGGARRNRGWAFPASPTPTSRPNCAPKSRPARTSWRPRRP